MTPEEQALRDSLPDEYKPMLDHFMAKADVTKIPRNKLETVIKREYQRAEAVGKEAERIRGGTHDDPLDPDLAHSTQDNGVKLRYETKAPDAHEVQQAAKIQAETGEPVELFGDTVRGDQYPGIDGVIGANRRPLSLKDVKLTSPTADLGGAQTGGPGRRQGRAARLQRRRGPRAGARPLARRGPGRVERDPR